KGPVGVSIWDEPHYKPGSEPPLDWLFRVAPHQTVRFCRSTYFGLVTRPATMDYNRYIRYGWNDRSAEPAQAFSPSHRGFMFTGALLVRRWAAAHARTAEPPFLDWANRMTAKWHALQYSQTGLMPHFFGAINPGDTEQSATP